MSGTRLKSGGFRLVSGSRLGGDFVPGGRVTASGDCLGCRDWRGALCTHGTVTRNTVKRPTARRAASPKGESSVPTCGWCGGRRSWTGKKIKRVIGCQCKSHAQHFAVCEAPLNLPVPLAGAQKERGRIQGDQGWTAACLSRYACAKVLSRQLPNPAPPTARRLTLEHSSVDPPPIPPSA